MLDHVSPEPLEHSLNRLTLPPRKPNFEGARSYHPSIDIKGACDPKANEVPRLPLSSRRLNQLEIEVGQEKLLVR